MTTTDTTKTTKTTRRPARRTTRHKAGPASIEDAGPARSGPVPDDAEPGVNEVHLLGRVTSVPVVVDLPSGDALVSFRVSVARSPGATRSGGATSGQRVDSVPCSAWSPALRRRIAGWRPGDTVEGSGAVCCRFYQAGGATRSRVEVVVSSARIIRRSPAA